MSALNLKTPGQQITLTCNLIFFCGKVIADTSFLLVSADSVYIGEGATIQNVVPQKAQSGAQGANKGDSGKDGAPGVDAFNMVLEAKHLLENSATDQLIFISQACIYTKFMGAGSCLILGVCLLSIDH